MCLNKNGWELSSGRVNGNSQGWDNSQDVDATSVSCKGKNQKSYIPVEISNRSSIGIGENLPSYDSYDKVHSLTTINL